LAFLVRHARGCAGDFCENGATRFAQQRVKSMRSVVRLVLVPAIALSLACGGKREGAAPAAKTPAKANAARPSSSGVAEPASSTGEVSVGSPMPPYTATTLDGGSFDLASERGNVVLLNLWATWCGPCRYEIPELQKLQDKNASRGFKVIGVSLDDGGADVVKQFVAEHKMTYPVLLDPDGKLANIFQTSVVPTTVLIDRKGKIVWKQLGAISEGDVSKALEAAINEKG
jgi:peroxiredoxin